MFKSVKPKAQAPERQPMKTIPQLSQLSFLLIATALLAACGGGGGGAPATVLVTVPAALAPEAAAPAYSAGSEESNTLALLNQERSNCGFGLLKQNAKLDQSAAAHAAYLADNSLLHGHREDPALPGYTGRNETERAAAVGYLNPVSAVLATLSGPPVAASTLTSTAQVRGLLASPYHLLSMLESVSDVGVGHRKKVGTDGVERQALNITMGRVEGVNDLDASQAYSYPCEGSTGVNAGLADETPSPIPSNLSQNNKLFGTPIAVKVRTGRVLVVISAIVTPTAGGPAVAVQIVSQANNTPRPDLMRANDAYVLPLSVLQPGTSYTVQLAATNDGQPFSKSFSFTTAN